MYLVQMRAMHKKYMKLQFNSRVIRKFVQTGGILLCLFATEDKLNSWSSCTYLHQ